MTETEADRAYYAAGEAAFIRRRGTPFLLSPRDFALLKEWRALGVPIEAVEQGIDEAFSRREERERQGRVNSLTYCRDAVIEAWERRAEIAAGRGSGRREMEDTDARAALERLAQELQEVLVRHPDIAVPLESARGSVLRLKESGKDAESIERSLARLDKRLAAALYEALPESQRLDLDAGVRSLIEKASVRMDEAAAEKTVRALTRRAIRQRLHLPRLSLI